MDPNNLRYAETHEWASLDGDIVTVGITQFAVEQLTDVVHVDLQKQPGDKVTTGERFGEIESVKAVSDLWPPVAGEVVDVNESLADDPDPVTNDPYGGGWMIKIKVAPGTTLGDLMGLKEYQDQIASEDH